MTHDKHNNYLEQLNVHGYVRNHLNTQKLPSFRVLTYFENLQNLRLFAHYISAVMSAAPPTATTAPRTWTRPNSEFFISNDPSLLSIKAVNEAFAQDFLYWGKPFPEEVLHQMLHSSMSFGVYKDRQAQSVCEPFAPTAESAEQIGLARMVTDGTTFGYLSDVYVLPEYQGHGLGRWLMNCVSEVFSKENMPYLRRIMLLTGDKRMQEFYAKVFGMQVIAHERRPDIGQDLVFMCARPNAKS